MDEEFGITRFEIKGFENLSKELVVMMKYFNLKNHDNLKLFKLKLDKLNERIENIHLDPVVLLSPLKRDIYDKLPFTFTTEEGLDVAEKMNMSKKKFKRFIKNDELFENLNDGRYKELLSLPF